MTLQQIIGQVNSDGSKVYSNWVINDRKGTATAYKQGRFIKFKKVNAVGDWEVCN